jgi:hypothetical protein
VVFERIKVGEQGPFIVWGFRVRHTLAGPGLFSQFLTGQSAKREDGTICDAGMDGSFWPSVHTLADLGLVERVGMLLDGEDPEAEIIHPYSLRDGEPAECELALAAMDAAQAMVTDEQLNWSLGQGYSLVPVQRHIANAAVTEIFRLRYRPHTTATAAWYALMRKSTSEYIVQYEALRKDRRTSATSAA